MSKLSGYIKVNKNQFLSKATKILLILALAITSIRPILSAQAAGAYTITYKDANGTVLSTTSANVSETVNLAAYPSGAIAWVDTNANMSIIDPSARGMAYINYNLANSAPATAQPFTMTMPARNVTLTAFYGDFNGLGNQPRLLQFYLDLSYHDINSGCDLAFAGQYVNISTPVRFGKGSFCAVSAGEEKIVGRTILDRWLLCEYSRDARK